MVWTLAVTVALGATPVQLPPGEDAAVWSEPMSYADLEVGQPRGGAYVYIENHGGTWTIEVHDDAGALRVAEIPAPTDTASREDCVWVVASLLTVVDPMAPASLDPLLEPHPASHEPAQAPAGPPRRASPARPAPPPPEPPPPPQPEPLPPVTLEVPEEVVPEPQATLPPPPPPVVAEASPVAAEPERHRVRPSHPPRPAPSVFPTIQLSGGTILRDHAGPTARLELDLGLASGPLEVGLVAAATTGQSVPGAGANRRSRETLFAATVGVTPIRALAVSVGLGATRRTFFDGTTKFAQGTVPVLLGATSLRAPIGRGVWLGPVARIAMDLRQVDVRVGGEPVDGPARLGFEPMIALGSISRDRSTSVRAWRGE